MTDPVDDAPSDDTLRLSYAHHVHTASGHRLFCLPGLTSWAGAAGIYCLHAAAYDGTDWVVTFQEQDTVSYHRRRREDGVTATDLAASAEHLCRYLPGVTVGHVVNATDGSPMSFTDSEAAALFDLLSWALFIAAMLSGEQPLVLVPAAAGTRPRHRRCTEPGASPGVRPDASRRHRPRTTRRDAR